MNPFFLGTNLETWILRGYGFGTWVRRESTVTIILSHKLLNDRYQLFVIITILKIQLPQ